MYVVCIKKLRFGWVSLIPHRQQTTDRQQVIMPLSYACRVDEKSKPILIKTNSKRRGQMADKDFLSMAFSCLDEAGFAGCANEI